jgi:TRAP-type C4-dicarboxylate transport system permease small subunit
MEPPLLRVVALRLLLIAVPFAIWFTWRAWARRSGREMGSTPYAWLVAAGAVLVGLSLIATVVFHTDNRRERYVPGEVTPSGAVTQGYFEKTTPSSASPPK